MKQDKTEVIIILDRSGSMSSIKTDMESGLKTFVEKQAKEPGECLISLYQFDTDYDMVFEAVSAKNVKQIVLMPRGSTALRDAIGKTINAVGERLNKTPEDERPSLVIVCTITDGFENASKEFSQDKIAEMVKHQRDVYNWQFLFLGANQDAVLAGASYGNDASKSLSFGANSLGVQNAMAVFTTGACCMRAAALVGNVAGYTNYSFSSAERDAALAVAPTPTTP